MNPKHFDGIVAWTKPGRPNGFIEASTASFRPPNAKPAVTRAWRPMRTVLFLIAGNSTSTASTPTRRNPLKNSKSLNLPARLYEFSQRPCSGLF